MLRMETAKLSTKLHIKVKVLTGLSTFLLNKTSIHVLPQVIYFFKTYTSSFCLKQVIQIYKSVLNKKF